MHRKPVLSFTILCLLFSSALLAQEKQGQVKIDSLIARVKTMKEDSNQVMVLNSIAHEYERINPDEGIRWAGKGLALAQKIGWRKGEGLAYKSLGSCYQREGNFPQALDALFKALNIFESIADKTDVGKVYNNIGLLYKNQKNYPKSLAYYNKSIRIAEEQHNKEGLEIGLGNIAVVYLQQGKFPEGLEYQKRSLAIAEEINDEIGISMQTGNIGDTYSAMRQYNEALAYEFKALRMCRAIGDKTAEALNLGNIGLTYFTIAKDSASLKPDSLVLPTRAANLSRGIAYLKEGIALCQRVRVIDGVQAFSANLSEALAMQGDFKGALAAYQQSVQAKDSLFNTANNEKLASLETKRALELKDKDIQIAKLEVAKKRNERSLFIAGIALLLGIMLVLFISFRKQRRNNKLLAIEKKRSDDLLLNILPEEVADELKNHGNAAAKQFDNVTVLFTDFVNFTGTAEQLSPQVLVKELHECFSAFDAIIERNGLEKIKTVGDAYIAVCGLPVPDPHHAQKCVKAAKDILVFMEERKKRERVFEIRIGINSGPVVAGIVGVKKFAYDIWGDTVNTAARMEQHGEPGKINISESTYQQVKEVFRCIRRGRIAAKNKGEIEMYFVEARMPELSFLS